MSIETWKAEFYPKPANETTEAEAIEHSLRKWIGLLPENLKKHDVTIQDHEVVGISEDFHYGLPVNAKSCSLCHHFYNSDWTEENEALDDQSQSCQNCPLCLTRGAACDAESPSDIDRNEDAPWSEFSPKFDRARYNPKPMIYWLKETKERYSA